MRTGIFRKASTIGFLTVLIILATMEGTKGDSLSLRGKSNTDERELHFANFPHNHFWPATIMPTSPDSEYYTDDLAINDNMIRDKKDLYGQEQKKEETIDESQPSVIAALDGSQALSSGAASWNNRSLMACGVHAVLVGSWWFW